jgi:hypothetical protein
MINLSSNLVARYTAFLTENGKETNRHHFYMKWLRYYLDFCTKYSFEWSESDSWSTFIIQLLIPELRGQAYRWLSFCGVIQNEEGKNYS